MAYRISHYYVDENGVSIITGEFDDKRKFELLEDAILAALDASTTWVNLGMFVCSRNEGAAVLCDNGEDPSVIVREFPAIFGISPLHKLTDRATGTEYERAVDELCATGETTWHDMNGRDYHFSEATQKHVRV